MAHSEKEMQGAFGAFRAVSILVLMDGSFRVLCAVHRRYCTTVSILVLMDGSFRVNRQWRSYQKSFVSILVLMDGSFRGKR